MDHGWSGECGGDADGIQARGRHGLRHHRTAPLDGARVPAPVRQIVIAFNHEIDASLVNEANITVERIGGPAPRNPLPLHATLATGDPTVIIIQPRIALGPGSYRVSLRGTGGGALADVNATALEADQAFAFAVDALP